MFVGGSGGMERAVGVAPSGVEEEEEEEEGAALLTSPTGGGASPPAWAESSPFPVAAGLHEVASGLSGVGGPERGSEAFIREGLFAP